MISLIPYKTAFVVNPASGSGHALIIWKKVAATLETAGQEHRVYYTQSRGDGTRLARQAADDGSELIVGVGGDGTLREIVNGLNLKKNILGIIPAGTGNGFRRSCNIPWYWATALKGLSQWSPRFVDIGEVNGTYFINTVGIGFDAAIEQQASGKYHNLKGYFPYIAAFFKELVSFKSFHSTIKCNGVFYEENNTLVIAVANGSYYGGKMCIAPQASIDDSFLDVCLVKKRRPPEITMLAAQVLFKKHLHSSSIITEKTRRVIIEADHEIPVHIDGDVIGLLPINIKIKPAALRLLAPPQK